MHRSFRSSLRCFHFFLTMAAFLLITTFFFSGKVSAGEGHRISIQFDGLADGECYLAYHFGNRQYMYDTTNIDMDGKAVFAGDEPLEAGLYLVVLEDETNFEVVIDKNQHFSISADPEDIMGTLSFEGSPENDQFYDYLHFLTRKNQRRQPLEAELRDPSTASDRQMALRQEIEKMNATMREKQDQIISENPDGLLALILKSQRDPELPEPPLLPDGRQDTDAMYQIYKSQFFDNIDFSDARILYTPVYHSRLRIYFNNVLMQDPDSIIREADRVIDKARAHPEVFEYTIWFITNNAEASQVMGMDKVFVHMVENYYLTDEVDWMDDQRLESMRQRAEELKPLLLGETAPDVRLRDPEGKTLGLHEIEADYLVLYFWDSECPFCLQAAPKLKETWEALKDDGVRIVAINTEREQSKWLDAISDYPQDWIHLHDAGGEGNVLDTYSIYAIPKVYILDEEKKILAKDIGIEHITSFIREHMRKAQ